MVGGLKILEQMKGEIWRLNTFWNKVELSKSNAG